VGNVATRLEGLGIVLPPPVPAPSDHVSFVQTGQLVFLSGHGPLDEHREPLYKGRVGAELNEADGHAAARLSALNVLATLDAELGDLDRVRRVVRLTGYVHSAPGFQRQPWVLNGASEVFTEVFGEDRGRHVRTSVGVFGLPLGMACALETVFEVA